MSSRILAAAIAAGCVTAAAGGAYLAVRDNGADRAGVSVATPAPLTPPAEAPAAIPPAVSETEGVVAPVAEPAPAPAREDTLAPSVPARRAAPAAPVSRPARPARPEPDPARSVRAAQQPPLSTVDVPAQAPRAPVAPTAERMPDPVASPAPIEPEPSRMAETRPPMREPQFEEVVLPATSVLGLRVDTPMSSERARLEDRVEARVSRDVTVDGRVAVPSGSRVIGSVTLVERGGKMKERARLGVRFHTLVLADGREVPLRTEAIMREGDSPSNESARKIGGAAIGGAILGAIMGGGKGAMMGGAVGAAGGSAAVMTGDRNAATLPAGTVVSVRLSGPAAIEVERPPQ